MPTIKEALEWCKKQVKDGKGDMHTGHMFVAEESAQAREDNAPDPITKKQKTKVAFETNDPDCYSEWHKERKRWMKAANKNPAVSTDAMIVRLRSATLEEVEQYTQTILEIRAQIAAQEATAAGAPQAVIPPEDEHDSIGDVEGD